MVEVQVKEKESFERALRRFKKMWERAGVLREIRSRAFYEKPSDTKREAKKKTVRRIKRLARLRHCETTRVRTGIDGKNVIADKRH